MSKEIIIHTKSKLRTQPQMTDVPLWLLYKLELEKHGIILKPTEPKKGSERQQI